MFPDPETKDIGKIVHVKWFDRNFTKLQEYFLCAKKTKNNFI